LNILLRRNSFLFTDWDVPAGLLQVMRRDMPGQSAEPEAKHKAVQVSWQKTKGTDRARSVKVVK
jgi:hypothetical protein